MAVSGSSSSLAEDCSSGRTWAAAWEGLCIVSCALPECYC